mmetsp:Transcript_58160/g.92448  ORF Transcript_58160/g.92448 Transcript_58160/m.92448 type:complete len:317 (-) Transcript_58160:15-965(-)
MSTSHDRRNPETEALLSKDSKDGSRSCFSLNEGFCCWKGSCCYEEEPSKVRDVFWDNWRGLAQMCVLFLHLGNWHLLTPPLVFVDSIPGRIYMGLFVVVGLICMPSFCFISGYFSEAQPQKRHVVNQVRYAFAWTINHSFAFLLAWYGLQKQHEDTWEAEHPLLNETNAYLESEGEPKLQPPGYVPVPFFGAVSVDWYLWCIIIWRCVLPMLTMLERPLFISFCISFTIMWTDAFHNVYSHSPFGFLPFFVAGFQFKELARDRQEMLLSYRGSRMVKCFFGGAVLAIVSFTFYSYKLRDYAASGVLCFYGRSVLEC